MPTVGHDRMCLASGPHRKGCWSLSLCLLMRLSRDTHQSPLSLTFGGCHPSFPALEHFLGANPYLHHFLSSWPWVSPLAAFWSVSPDVGWGSHIMGVCSWLVHSGLSSPGTIRKTRVYISTIKCSSPALGYGKKWVFLTHSIQIRMLFADGLLWMLVCSVLNSVSLLVERDLWGIWGPPSGLQIPFIWGTYIWSWAPCPIPAGSPFCP